MGDTIPATPDCSRQKDPSNPSASNCLISQSEKNTQYYLMRDSVLVHRSLTEKPMSSNFHDTDERTAHQPLDKKISICGFVEKRGRGERGRDGGRREGQRMNELTLFYEGSGVDTRSFYIQPSPMRD